MYNNIFYIVFNQNDIIVAISRDRLSAQYEALNQSGHRWALQNFKKDWGYLENDGYIIIKKDLSK